MNRNPKFIFAAALLALASFLLPGSAQADTTYTYTGNAYTSCSGDYALNGGIGATCGATYALSLTFDTSLSGSQLDGFVGNMAAYVTSFSITDGAEVSINQTDPYVIGNFLIGTAADGSILLWNIDIISSLTSSFPDVEASTNNDEDFTANNGIFIPDLGPKIIANGQVTDDPGQWVEGGSQAETPELPSGILFGAGLLAMIGFGMCRRRSLSAGTL